MSWVSKQVNRHSSKVNLLHDWWLDSGHFAFKNESKNFNIKFKVLKTFAWSNLYLRMTLHPVSVCIRRDSNNGEIRAYFHIHVHIYHCLHYIHPYLQYKRFGGFQRWKIKSSGMDMLAPPRAAEGTYFRITHWLHCTRPCLQSKVLGVLSGDNYKIKQVWRNEDVSPPPRIREAGIFWHPRSIVRWKSQWRTPPPPPKNYLKKWYNYYCCKWYNGTDFSIYADYILLIIAEIAKITNRRSLSSMKTEHGTQSTRTTIINSNRRVNWYCK